MPDLEEIADEALRWFDRAAADHEAGRLAEALAGARRAVRGFARAGGAGHPDTANARGLVGRVLQSLGRPRDALAQHRRAAAALARVRGGGEGVAALLTHARLGLARCLMDLGRHDEARAAGRDALRVATRSLGARSELAGHAHNILGMAGKYTGRWDEGARHYAAARPIYRRLFGERSREMATLWHNLGGLEHARGRFARGEPPARKAVEVGRLVLPAGHPELLAHEVAHAALLDGLGRHDRSLPVYRRAVRAFTRLYGREHYEVASTLHNLAGAEADHGRTAQALRHYGEAVALYRKLLGATHPDVALSLHNAGVLHAERGDRAAAARLLRQAERIFRATLGPRHPHTAACRTALADLNV